jgi:hypothetical protein
MTRPFDPFGAAVLVCGVALGSLAMLVAGLVGFELVHGVMALWPVFLAASAVAWLTIDAWSPLSARPWRQVGALVAFVCVEALALTPLVAVGWEVAGARAILGAVLATGATCAGLTVFALMKPTTYLEPIDPLVVLGVMGLAVSMVGIGLGLPIGLVWAVPLIAVTGTLALDQIASVAVFGPGQHIAGGTRLFGCASVLFAELVYYFVSMTRGEDLLRTLFVRLAAGAAAA